MSRTAAVVLHGLLALLGAGLYFPVFASFRAGGNCQESPPTLSAPRCGSSPRRARSHWPLYRSLVTWLHTLAPSTVDPRSWR